MLGKPLIWPALVVFDLDFTLVRIQIRTLRPSRQPSEPCVLWQWHRPRFRGGPPWTPIDEGFGGVKSSSGELLNLYPAARTALLELSDADVPVAIASRTHRPKWARQWLELLSLEPGGRTAADVISLIVIQDGPKPSHLKELRRRTVLPRHPPPRPPPPTASSLIIFLARAPAAHHPALCRPLTNCLHGQGVPLGSMLFFDDNLADVRAAAHDGVTSVHCVAADRRRQRCSLAHPLAVPL